LGLSPVGGEVRQHEETIAQLQDEIASSKVEEASQFKPSQLDKKAGRTRSISEGKRRVGERSRPVLEIHEEGHPPASGASGFAFTGLPRLRRPDLVIQAIYALSPGRWRRLTADPDRAVTGVGGGRHFGPTLVSYISISIITAGDPTVISGATAGMGTTFPPANRRAPTANQACSGEKDASCRRLACSVS